MLALAVGAALLIAEIGPLLIAADYAPLLWFADLTLYLDAMIVVGVAFATVRVRLIGSFVLASLRKAGGIQIARRRARSSKSQRPKRSAPANDDAPGWALRATA